MYYMNKAMYILGTLQCLYLIVVVECVYMFSVSVHLCMLVFIYYTVLMLTFLSFI